MTEWDENLEFLKRHHLFPFHDYRIDDEQYMLAELYWTTLFKTVVGGNTDRAWRAWHPPDVLRDGNPIFSAIHLEYGRGARVIQDLEQRSATDLSAHSLFSVPAIPRTYSCRALRSQQNDYRTLLRLQHFQRERISMPHILETLLC